MFKSTDELGKRLNLPVKSVPVAEATHHFGPFGNFFGLDGAATSTATQDQLGWKPTREGILAEMEKGEL